MHLRAASAQGETTPGFEVFGGKRPKRSSSDEEAQKSLAVITVDSLERAPDALLALEGTSHNASREACASLEDGVLTERPPNADGVMGEAPIEMGVGSSFSAMLANIGPCKPRPPNWLMLGIYVMLQEWNHSSEDKVAPGPEAAMFLLLVHECEFCVVIFF